MLTSPVSCGLEKCLNLASTLLPWEAVNKSTNVTRAVKSISKAILRVQCAFVTSARFGQSCTLPGAAVLFWGGDVMFVTPWEAHVKSLERFHQEIAIMKMSLA